MSGSALIVLFLDGLLIYGAILLWKRHKARQKLAPASANTSGYKKLTINKVSIIVFAIMLAFARKSALGDFLFPMAGVFWVVVASRFIRVSSPLDRLSRLFIILLTSLYVVVHGPTPSNYNWFEGYGSPSPALSLTQFGLLFSIFLIIAAIFYSRRAQIAKWFWPLLAISVPITLYDLNYMKHVITLPYPNSVLLPTQDFEGLTNLPMYFMVLYVALIVYIVIRYLMAPKSGKA